MRTIEEIEAILAETLSADALSGSADWFMKTWTHAPGTPDARPLIVPVVEKFDFAGDGVLKIEDAHKIYPDLTNEEWAWYLTCLDTEDK